MVNAVLFSSAKKHHKKAVDGYSKAVAEVQNSCDALNVTRNECISALERIENTINSIANSPKKIKKQVSDIHIAQIKYRDTKSFTKEAIMNTVVSGAVAAIGIGLLFAALRSRNYILALFCLIISPILIIISIFGYRKKDKKITIDANSSTKELNAATAQLGKTNAFVIKLHKETNTIYMKLKQQIASAQPLFGRNYKDMSRDEKKTLGAIINNTSSLAVLLNKKAESK
jgi:chromosome segregation ATPase